MRVARLFGIDIYIDLSWFIIFVLVAWMLSSDVGPLRSVGLSGGDRVALGILTAILFFASVLAHELAHSIVARMRGLPVSRITLFIFGGISQIGADFESAGGEGWIAFVGPLTSAVLSVLFYLGALALGSRSAVGLASGYLAWANGALAIFNLVPAYPLDGGKVLHSLIWRATGDRLRATRIAVAIGQTIAFAMVAFGILTSFTVNFFSGLWTALIGWFLFQAGRMESYQSQLGVALRGHTAGDVATAAPTPFSPQDSARVATEALLRSGQRAAAVVGDGRLAGIVTLSDLARSHASSADTPVSALMTPVDKIKSISAASDPMQALALLAQSGYHQLPIIDDGGAVVGFITREGLLQRLALAH